MPDKKTLEILEKACSKIFKHWLTNFQMAKKKEDTDEDEESENED